MRQSNYCSLFKVLILNASLAVLFSGCSIDYPLGDLVFADSISNDTKETFIPPTCGNGSLEGDEFCDPTATVSTDCRDVSSWFASGVATCTPDCRWDFGDCIRHSSECGNGILEPGEACEPSLNPSTSCASISPRFVSGEAPCGQDCTFIVTSCIPGKTTCGDGIIEGEEECDEGPDGDGSRCSSDCQVLVNGQVARFEAPNHESEMNGISPFMNEWVCNDPKRRADWHNRSEVQVNYEIHICEISSNPVISINDIRLAMTEVQAVFRLAAINLIESSVTSFTWPNCTVDYDSSSSFNNFILENSADGAIPLVFVRDIVSSKLSFFIGGYGGPNSPVVLTSARRNTIAHELGHKFGLSHTFECEYGFETSAECEITGDRVCDTPPDHGPKGVFGIAECLDNTNLNGTCDCEGKCGGTGSCTTGERPDCSKIMSYYHCWPGDFSNSQMDYMRCSLENELNHFVASCQARTETCNGLDDDCDGKIDENLTRSCGKDEGSCRKGKQTCINGRWGECQGSVSGIEETCDGRDNDCDGQTDEDLVRTCGLDIGECVSGRKFCRNGNWDTECIGGINPRPEICDNRDNDCDGSTDEGINPLQQPIIGRCPSKGICSGEKAKNVCVNGAWKCEYPSGFTQTECKIVSTDCGTGSGKDESCNDNLDNDCDGVTDENSLYLRCRDLTDFYKIQRGDICFGGPYGRCQLSGGTYECVQLAENCGVQIDCVGKISSEEERCDGQDWDCDGKTYDRKDNDNDGYGDCFGHVDCDDSNPSIHPGATEICDGKDNDCNGLTDEKVDCGINKSCVKGKCQCLKACGTSCCSSTAKCCGSYCMPNSATCAIEENGCYCPAGYEIANSSGGAPGWPKPSVPVSCYPGIYSSCGRGTDSDQLVCPLTHECCSFLANDYRRCCRNPAYSDNPFYQFYCQNCPDEEDKFLINTIPFTCAQTN